MQTNKLGRVSGSRGTPKKRVNNGKNRRKNKKGNTRKNLVMRSQIHISKCALDYARALFDPFGAYYSQASPCIPDLFDLPSKKFCTLTRGEFGCGSAGFGFVSINPYVWGRGVAGADGRIGTFSTGAYAGTQIESHTFTDPVPNPPGIFTVNNAQFPYASPGPFPDIRVVGCGMRCRYIGTQLNMGGRVLPIADNSVGANLNFHTYQALASRQDAVIYPAGRSWHGTFLRPSAPFQMQYSAAQGTVDVLFMALVANSQAGNVFEYEIVTFYEAVPSATVTVDSTSASHSDIVGLSAIRDFVGQLSSSSAGQGVYNSFLKKVGNIAHDSMSYVAAGSVAGATAYMNRNHMLALEESSWRQGDSQVYL